MINHLYKIVIPLLMITCDKTTKQAIHSHVAMKCCTCFKVWEIYVAFTDYPILFTTIKHETYTVENVTYACFSNNGNGDIDDAYVYEVKCN